MYKELFPPPKRGRPPTSEEDVPLPPLYAVYQELAAWFEEHMGKDFAPSFDEGDTTGNTAAMVLWSVAHALDSKHMVANCEWAHRQYLKARRDYLKSAPRS